MEDNDEVGTFSTELLEDLGYTVGDFPETERLADQMLSLPMFPELTEQQIDRVSDAVASFFVEDGRKAKAASAAA